MNYMNTLLLVDGESQTNKQWRNPLQIEHEKKTAQAHKSHTQSIQRRFLHIRIRMLYIYSLFFVFLSLLLYLRTGTMFNCHNSSSLKYDKIRWFFVSIVEWV